MMRKMNLDKKLQFLNRNQNPELGPEPKSKQKPKHLSMIFVQFTFFKSSFFNSR